MTEFRLLLVLCVPLVFTFQSSPQNPPDGKGSTATSAVNSNSNQVIRKTSTHSGEPVVGTLQRSNESAEAHSRRQQKEAFYSEHSNPWGVEDPGKFVHGDQETTNLRFINGMIVYPPDAKLPQEPFGLPVQSSAAVLVGTVLSGAAHATEDHKTVYSDYTVRVDSLLKQDEAHPLSAGDNVIASRMGGAIRFPSGHVTNFLIGGQGLPKVGSQYLLFLLKMAPDHPEYDHPEYQMYIAYELRDAHVYALDEAESKHNGEKQTALIGQVQTLVATLVKGGQP